jgi:hypothetical protein
MPFLHDSCVCDFYMVGYRRRGIGAPGSPGSTQPVNYALSRLMNLRGYVSDLGCPCFLEVLAEA